MWIMTSAGFVSAVARYNDFDHLTVRARDKRSAEALVDELNELNTNGYFELVESYTHDDIKRGTEKQDYRWRVVVHRADFAAYVSYEVMTYLIYHNFKDAATKARGDVYHDSLMDVWWAMRDLTKDEDGLITKKAKFNAYNDAWFTTPAKALLETPEGVTEDPDYLDDWGKEPTLADVVGSALADIDEDEDVIATNQAIDMKLNSMTDDEFAHWAEMSEEDFATWLKERA